MKHVLDPCPDDVAFRFQNGARARSLDELRKNVENLPGPVLDFHKAHFHHWIRDVLGDPRLAETVKTEADRARDAEQLRRKLDDVLGRSIEDNRGLAPGGMGGRGFTGSPGTRKR